MRKSRLVGLDLSDNAIGAVAVESLVPLLVENRSLRVLKLNNVGFGPAAGTIAAKALHLSALIQSMHNQSPTLRVIVCGQSRLENGSASAWGDVFAAYTNLVAVHIPQNGMRETGLNEIARALKSCPSLRYLNVSDNLVRDEECDSARPDPDVDAATALAKALSSWPDLEYLNMSDCCLGASGTRQILDALAEGNNTNLHSLLLENAAFDDGDSFGATLLKALDRSLPNLVILKLAEHDDLGDTEQGVWAEIVGIISGRLGGLVSFERDIEDPDDTAFLDRMVAGLVDESASMVEAMAGLSVSL
jgi:Ran GTPase-activating protein 1